MGRVVKYTDELIYTNSTGSNIAAGDVVTFNSGALAGVAICPIAAGESGSVYLSGVWELPTGTTFTCTQGAAAYWDATGGKVIASVASGSTAPQIGVFAETLSASRGAVQIVLNVAAITKTGA